MAGCIVQTGYIKGRREQQPTRDIYQIRLAFASYVCPLQDDINPDLSESTSAGIKPAFRKRVRVQ